MNLTFSDKAEMNRRMRAIFVKHWIDLGRMTFSVSGNGIIHINGYLGKLPGTGELTVQAVSEMIGEIESIQHVIRVEAEFDNWQRSGFAGMWKSLEKSGQSQTSSSTEKTGQTISIKVKQTPDS